MISDDVMRAYEEGWSLLPIKRNKKPHVAWEKFQQERASLEQVIDWANSLNPSAWAAVTGALSNMVALDFDGPDGLNTMQSFDLNPHTRSGSGWCHVYVTHPGTRVPTLNAKTSKMLGLKHPGLDIRGDGGYIIFTGESESGRYERLRPLKPDPFESLPEPLLNVLLGSKSDTQADNHVEIARSKLIRPDDYENTSALIDSALQMALTEGRNNAGFGLACSLRDAGLTKDDALLAMIVYQRTTLPNNRKGQSEPYTEEEARASLESAYSRVRPRSGRPTVIVNISFLDEKVDEALAAFHVLNDPPSVFERGGALVRLRTNELGRPVIQAMTKDMVRYELGQAADFVQKVGKKEVPVDPPMPVVSTILAHPQAGFPPLQGVVESPMLRSDGSITEAGGYDEKTGFYVAPPRELKVPLVPENPAPEVIATARELIFDELFHDFPFVDDASRANAGALLITCVIREAISGLIPMTLINAPAQGTGKSFLVTATTLVASGCHPTATTAPSGDEEFRKRLTSVLYGGERYVFLDNVDDVLKSPVLAALLTSEWWGDRLLGHTKFVRFKHRAICMATGNNLAVGGDMASRCISINLDSKLARPWERKFRHVHLDNWILENRGDLLWAVFVLARAWYAAGKPEPLAPPIRGCYGWRQLIGGMLEVAGISGFLENLHQLYEDTDSETAEIANFLNVWLGDHGTSPIPVAQLSLAASSPVAIAMPTSLLEHIAAASTTIAAQSRLGQFLARIQGRRFDDAGLRVERAGKDGNTHAVLWRVVKDNIA
ncbi:MAG: bifunctional DNA primase/polymerase [Actinomycetota bacterium]